MDSIWSFVSFMFVMLLLLGWSVYKQVVPRKVKENPTLYIILACCGFYMLMKSVFYGQVQLTLFFVLTQIGILSILAVGGGTLRAFTCKLWYENDTYMKKGTWLTLSIFFLTLAIHVCIDIFFEKGGEYTILLYYGVSLLTQQIIVSYRAKILASAS